jgi:hypothetical protein
MRHLLAIAAAICTASILAVSGSVPAGASHGSGPKVTATTTSNAFRATFDGTLKCSFDSTVRATEFGKHGVTRLKFRLYVYLGDVPDRNPQWLVDKTASVHRTGLWVAHAAFPNDRRSFSSTVRFNWPQAHAIAISSTARVKVVGVRPSWWEPDLVTHVTLGHCSTLGADLGSGVDGSGGLDPPGTGRGGGA